MPSAEHLLDVSELPQVTRYGHFTHQSRRAISQMGFRKVGGSRSILVHPRLRGRLVVDETVEVYF